MADVAVVGAGLGGLATAARLAKLGHRVTVCERGAAPGGLLGQVHHDGLTWDATPMQTTIPAVLRDLFRKSGRPLERYVDLELSSPARRHVFADGSTLDLPTGSRGAQLEAVSDALGPAAGELWTRFVDGQTELWALLRAEVLDVPTGAANLAERRLSRALNLKQSLERLLRKAFDDPRLRQLASYPALRSAGSAPQVPAFRVVDPYVERLFGIWRSAGGARDLAAALMQRMGERSVDVRFGAEVASLNLDAGRVTGLQLTHGEVVAADIVVTAVSPSLVFGHLLPAPVARTAVPLFAATSARPVSTVTYLGLSEGCPSMANEVVLHGDPLLIVSSDAPADASTRTWTVTTCGPADGDVLGLMAQRGIDVRELATARLDRPGRVDPPWDGVRPAVARAALFRPLPGLYCLGTGLVLGSTIPYVAWQAAHVAETIGKA